GRPAPRARPPGAAASRHRELRVVRAVLLEQRSTARVRILRHGHFYHYPPPDGSIPAVERAQHAGVIEHAHYAMHEAAVARLDRARRHERIDIDYRVRLRLPPQFAQRTHEVVSRQGLQIVLERRIDACTG